jgi:phosphoribosyl 1,2-cyclic phosphodiesterase
MKKDPVWLLKFYGTRGSIPVCENNFHQFGGNTTCIYVDLLIKEEHNFIMVFDAGTGIRKLGRDIRDGKIPDAKVILIAFTHFHWDHIQGFPFFDPSYQSDKEIVFFSPHQKMNSDELKQIFNIQMQKEYFPVQLNNMGAELKFFTAEEYLSYLNIDQKVKSSYRLHNHSGGAFSYRLDAEERSIVICTDLEHGERIDPEVVAFCKDADLLIHDAQYTDEELQNRHGWGHSSYSQAIEVAKLAKVKRLAFTHHDPDHNDEFLAKIEVGCQLKFPNCFMAREGMEIFV